MLEIVLAVGVLVLLGAVGWMYFANNDPNTKQNGAVNNTDSSDKSKEKNLENQPGTDIADEKVDKTADWTTYQPDGKQYKIKFADGWTLRMKSGGGGESLYATGSLAIKEGASAKVLKADPNAPGHLDNCSNPFILDYLDYAFPDKYKSANSEKLKTNAGLEIEKTVGKDTTGVDGYATTYSYTVMGNKEHIRISYFRCPDHAANHYEIVEQVVKSIEMD